MVGEVTGMEYKILWSAGIKKHKGSLAGIFLLMLFVSLAMGTVLTVWRNSDRYVRSEIRRAGFGELTAWVSKISDTSELVSEIKGLEGVEQVDRQDVIYADYEIGDQESDSEGQLIPIAGEEDRYRFFTDDLSGYRETTPEIRTGEVYVSPSMISMFGVGVGNDIIFSVARSGKNVSFRIKGFYEDPFMGSSMIGMKGFLISPEDSARIRQMTETAGKNALAKNGAMLHIFIEPSAGITVSEMNRLLNENTSLPEYAEFVHSENVIAGFMLILQNAFSGLLTAFVLVLLFTVLVTLGHSLGGGIEADYVNMGILKTLGLTTGMLWRIQLMQYLTAILSGMVLGVLLSLPGSRIVCEATITTTGVKIPSVLPVGWCTVSCLTVLVLLILFIYARTGRIGSITPMRAIRCPAGRDISGMGEKIRHMPGQLIRKGLTFRLAVRQLASGKRQYLGVCLVAALLVFFASLAGRMDSWLGSDGRGMMAAFNPADHDIGVQVFGDLMAEEAEEIVRSYTDITDSYLLAMPQVSVNGSSYTANVITEPERFHMLQGRTCVRDDEIVLTESAAADMGISAGDSLTVRGDAGMGEYTVSGIYQCANDMGANIGMNREGYSRIGRDDPHLWCYHYFLRDAAKKQEITRTLEDSYGGDVHVHENSWPGLYGIITAMHALLVLMYSMVMVFILIVTWMAVSRILAAEKRDLGIYMAMGFTSIRLRLTFAIRFCLTAAAGSIAGTILAAAATDPLVSAVMKLAGISNFASHPGIIPVIFPAVIVSLLFGGAACLLTGKIRRLDVTVLAGDE